MSESQVCQWCSNEIIWDEEIGPESHCPHCENELSGYRTVELQPEQEDASAFADEVEEEEEEDLGFRGGTLSDLAAESTAQRILDAQLEVPECPSCREYMLEAGEQEFTAERFKPTIPQELGHPLVDTSFHLTWYICPSCYQTSSQLSKKDREFLQQQLARGAAE